MVWDSIRNEYETTFTTLKALAEKHNVKLGTLKSRKSREGWERGSPKMGATSLEKVATKTKKDATLIKEENPVFVESEGLTDKQRLFCIYYVKSFNATQSAIKAGYAPDSAHVEGSRLLRNAKVADEIRRIKGNMMQGVFIDAMDVLNKYIKIAFADITDFVEFGTEEVPGGELEEELTGVDQSYIANYVRFKGDAQVDGTIITEVKKGKDGVSIKLADKMKALEMLTKYFELLPEHHKRKLEEEKLKVGIEKTKAETEKLAGKDDEGPIEIVIKRKGERS